MTKILFADDDTLTLNLMGQAATLLGHQAVLAKTGREALTLIGEEHPAIVFLDMMLPDMEGLTVLCKIKETPEIAATPVIVLSAGVSADDSALCQKNGAAGYILKPISIQLLADTIQKYCSTGD